MTRSLILTAAMAVFATSAVAVAADDPTAAGKAEPRTGSRILKLDRISVETGATKTPAARDADAADMDAATLAILEAAEAAED